MPDFDEGCVGHSLIALQQDLVLVAKGRRLAEIAPRASVTNTPQPLVVVARVRLAVETAVAVMLAEPDVNRAVMGWIGTPGPAQGDALARSTAYWALALADGEGATEPQRASGQNDLPRMLALAFRDASSFWTAGELADEALCTTAIVIANTLMLAVTSR